MALAELLRIRPELVRTSSMRTMRLLSDLGFERCRVEVRDASGKVTETGVATFQRGQHALSLVLTSRLARALRLPWTEERSQELAPRAREVLNRASTDVLFAAAPRVLYVDSRVYAYVWGGPDDDASVQSGAQAAVGLAASSGDLVSFQMWLPSKPTTPSEVTVTEAQARETIIRTYPNLRPLLPAKATLVLNTPISPSAGPVWLYRIAEASGERSAVVVDAVTGKVLQPQR